MTSNLFRIAGHYIEIRFKEGGANDMRLLPSFEPFRQSLLPEGEPLLLSLTVDDALRPIPKDQREHIRDFDTGNGITRVDRLADGGYQYIIRNIAGGDCALLITDNHFTNCRCALNGSHTMRMFGLNNALMLIYAFSASRHQTVLIHASLVRHNGRGYAFTAKSGTGKSTHVSLWLQNIPDCDLMNDDNPIIRIHDDGKPYIYGGPWSGKTPCYRDVMAPLGAISRIERAPSNSVEPLQPIEAFATLLPACSSMKWDEEVFAGICQTVTHIIETTNIYVLRCLPNAEAAIVCQQAIAK